MLLQYKLLHLYSIRSIIMIILSRRNIDRINCVMKTVIQIQYHYHLRMIFNCMYMYRYSTLQKNVKKVKIFSYCRIIHQTTVLQKVIHMVHEFNFKKCHNWSFYFCYIRCHTVLDFFMTLWSWECNKTSIIT